MRALARRLPLPFASQHLFCCHSDEWVVFEAIKGWLVQTPAAPAEVVHRLLGHVRFPRLAKHRQVQLETDELALQHAVLIAKAYREKLHGEDTPRTRARRGARPARPALQFEELRPNMPVQVMDDLEFVKAECNTTQPGATVPVGWAAKMATAIGRVFCVMPGADSINTNSMSADLATAGQFGMTTNFVFPHTVLIRIG